MKNEIEFEIQDLGDDDANLYEVTAKRDDLTVTVVNRDYSAAYFGAQNKLIELEKSISNLPPIDLIRKFNGINPKTPNFENLEISFLMK